MTADGWQPIETAPKDGTLILVWDGTHRDLVRWEDGRWFCIVRGGYARENDHYDGICIVDAPIKWAELPE